MKTEKENKMHAIINAWLDDGIDNGIFYSQEEVTEFRNDLLNVDESILNSLYNFWTKGTFDFTKKSTVEKTCTCGAKHTSNPKFHLSYCELDHE